MAWQQERASSPQIAVKAALRPIGRTSALKGVRQPGRAGTHCSGLLGAFTAMLSRPWTTDQRSPPLNKIGRFIRSPLMIAVNLGDAEPTPVPVLTGGIQAGRR
jgi:hypothetical protein